MERTLGKVVLVHVAGLERLCQVRDIYQKSSSKNMSLYRQMPIVKISNPEMDKNGFNTPPFLGMQRSIRDVL